MFARSRWGTFSARLRNLLGVLKRSGGKKPDEDRWKRNGEVELWGRYTNAGSKDWGTIGKK